MFLAARATLLDAAKGHDAEEEDEKADGAGDDTDLSALGECGPAVADAGGGLDFLENFGGVFCAAAGDESQHILFGRRSGWWWGTYATTLTFFQSPLASMSSQLYSLALV